MSWRRAVSLGSGVACVLLLGHPVWAGGPIFTGDLEVENPDPDLVLDDTSVNSTQWELSNDGALPGGAPAESFAIGWIDDLPAGNGVPFKIETGTPSNALYLDSSGDVGLGTAAPTEDLHVFDAGTAAVRLDSMQVVYDVQGGSADDFDIEIVTNNTGAPTGFPFSIEDSNGHVGIWDAGVPTASLSVRSPDNATSQIEVRNTSGTGDRVMFIVRSTGGAPQYDFIRDTTPSNFFQWRMELDAGGQYRFCKGGDPACALTLSSSSSATFPGVVNGQVFNTTSSKALKTGFRPVDTGEMLERVAALPISEWSFRADSDGQPHVGPMAEDFRASFGLGDGKHIATVDADGVALAAIQGLRNEKDAEIAALRAELQELKLMVRNMSSSQREGSATEE